MTDMKRISFESFIHVAIVVMAVLVRLVLLGDAPLSDLEANWAMQARNVALGSPGNVGPQPAYVILTGLLFHILDDTNFLARFLPALFGGLMVSTAYAFRGKLGRIPAILLALGLAFDPGLVAVSRLAGGPMLALSLPVLAVSALYAGFPVLGGILIGLGLLSGSPLWALLLSAGIALALLQPLKRSIFDRNRDAFGDLLRRMNPGRRGLVAALLTFLIVGTGFVFTPSALGAFANSIPAYFAGWFSLTGVPISRMISTYFLYNPLAIVFAMVAIFLAWKDGRDFLRGISIWWLVAVVIVIVYPARQTPDLVFLLFPTWILAGAGLQQLFRRDEHILISTGQAGLIVVLMIMLYLTFANFQTADLTQSGIQNWGFMLAVAAMVIASTVLVGLGWSWKAAFTGFGWGAGIVMGVSFFSATTMLVSQNQNDIRELWYPAPVVEETELLMETIGQYGLKQSGRADTLDMAVFFDVASIRWMLRDVHGVDFYSQPRNITDKDAILSLARDEALIQEDLYQGQDFPWWAYPGWEGGLPQEWWRWMTFREAPIVNDKVVLWVRADIFAGIQE